MYLDGGVELVLVTRLNSFKPLDDWFDITADFALERRGSSVVYSGVDWVSTSQDRLRLGTLC